MKKLNEFQKHYAPHNYNDHLSHCTQEKKVLIKLEGHKKIAPNKFEENVYHQRYLLGRHSTENNARRKTRGA